MTRRLEGKVALVTGGTAGIGEATVLRLAQEGASVVFTGSNRELAAKVSAAGGGVFVPHHVDDVPGWKTVAETINSRFGRLDIVFANAGTNSGDGHIEELSLEAWNRIIAINLTGAMLACQYGIALMKSNPNGPSGSIILNSSVTGIQALPGDVTYCTTKGALRLLAKSVAVHCAKSGYKIRCNSIHPGIIDTPLMRGVAASTPDPAATRKFFDAIAPLGRMGTSEEVAGLVAYLASDDAAFVTGAELVIDGGSTAGFSGV